MTVVETIVTKMWDWKSASESKKFKLFQQEAWNSLEDINIAMWLFDVNTIQLKPLMKKNNFLKIYVMKNHSFELFLCLRNERLICT